MSTSERINGFDALRTVAMWLGIVLHSIIAYKVIPEKGWPYDPAFSSVFLDWLYDYIHIFRMPLFFMVAGFFARLVIMKSGINYFIQQRFKRIVVPFIIGLIIIVPFTMFPFHFNRYYNFQHFTLAEAWNKSISDIFAWGGLAHLWFLYYLILFYILSGITGFLRKKFFVKYSDKLNNAIGNVSFFKLLLAALLLFVLFMGGDTYIPPVYTGLKISVFSFLYYYFFYVTGWLMQINQQSIRSLSGKCNVLFIFGTALSIFLFWNHVGFPSFLLFLLKSIETICLVAGITGLFIKYFHAENKVWRYCSDAAYWIYLIHMVIVASMQILLLNSSVAPIFRFPLVLLITFSLSIFTYHFFVRYTIIGEYLHGKRNRSISGKPVMKNIL